jgi:hypothetical protein
MLTLLVVGTGLPTSLVAAHEGGELAISIPVERIAPGDDLPVIGEDWAPAEVLEVSLQQGTEVTDLGAVRTGADGHFVRSIPIPATLTPGPVIIEVASAAGVRARAVVTIDPDAPAPSFQTQDGESTHILADEGIDLVPIVALLAAFGALGVLFIRTRRSSGTNRPT